MKLLPLLLRGLALLALLFSPALRADDADILDDHPSWKKLHPNYKKYTTARDKENWAEAAKYIGGFNTAKDHFYYHEAYAEVLTKAGHHAEALGHLDAALRKRYAHNSNDFDLVPILYKTARYAAEHKLTSTLPVVLAMTKFESGEADIGFGLLQNIAEGDVCHRQRQQLQYNIAAVAFRRAASRGDDSPAAAALANFIVENSYHIGLTGELCIELADALEKEGENERALLCLEANVSSERFSAPQQLQQAKKAATLVNRHKLTTQSWLINASALHQRGDTRLALAALDKISRENRNAPAFQNAHLYMLEMIPEAMNEASAREDWLKVAQVGAYLDRFTVIPDDIHVDHLITAYEKIGKPALAVELCLNCLWTFSDNANRLCDVQGNPELVKRAAEIAHRHKLRTNHPLADAWLHHLNGKTQTALALLNGIASAHREFQSSYSSCAIAAVAKFLTGELHRSQGDLVNALTDYHKATYLVSYHCIYLTEEIQGNSHFHEALGVIRQSEILLLQNKPALARRELDGLLSADAQIGPEVIGRYLSLRDSWKTTSSAVDAALKNSGPSSAPGSEDQVYFDGYLKAREPVFSVVSRIRGLRAEAMADARYRKQREIEKSSNTNRFLESYLAQERENAIRLVESTSPPPASSSTAFDFQGRLSNTQQPTRRRCSFCLGSGRANYVTGGKYYATDSHGVATNNEVAAPNCTHCNGTGWR